MTQQVKSVRVEREDTASKAFVTLALSGSLVQPQIVRENEARGKLERAAWLAEQEKSVDANASTGASATGKGKQGRRRLLALLNADGASGKVEDEEPEWPRAKSEATNLTSVEVPHTVKRWSQTLNVHHHCPTFGWFPRVWGAGVYGKYANISVEIQFAKPVYAPLRLHYRKHCGGWLASPIGITGVLLCTALVAFASWWCCCRAGPKRGKRT